MASDDNVTPIKQRRKSRPKRILRSDTSLPQLAESPTELVTRGNKLNPATHDSIVMGVLAGHSLERVALSVGLGHVTIHKWKQRGEKAIETHLDTGLSIPATEKPYANLALDIALAYKSLEAWALDNWMKSLLAEGAPRDWADFLARRFPDRWSPQTKLTGKDGDPLAITLSSLVREAASLGSGEEIDVVDAEIVD